MLLGLSAERWLGGKELCPLLTVPVGLALKLSGVNAMGVTIVEPYQGMEEEAQWDVG